MTQPRSVSNTSMNSCIVWIQHTNAHRHKNTICTHFHTPTCLNTYKEPIVCIDAQRHTHTLTHINLGKIRSRRSTVEWQHVLTMSTLNGPCFLLIYKTFLSVYSWHFYSDTIYMEAGFWEQPNPKYVVVFHIHTLLRHIWFCLHLKHERTFATREWPVQILHTAHLTLDIHRFENLKKESSFVQIAC